MEVVCGSKEELIKAEGTASEEDLRHSHLTDITTLEPLARKV